MVLYRYKIIQKTRFCQTNNACAAVSAFTFFFEDIPDKKHKTPCGHFIGLVSSLMADWLRRHSTKISLRRLRGCPRPLCRRIGRILQNYSEADGFAIQAFCGNLSVVAFNCRFRDRQPYSGTADFSCPRIGRTIKTIKEISDLRWIYCIASIKYFNHGIFVFFINFIENFGFFL